MYNIKSQVLLFDEAYNETLPKIKVEHGATLSFFPEAQVIRQIKIQKGNVVIQFIWVL